MRRTLISSILTIGALGCGGGSVGPNPPPPPPAPPAAPGPPAAVGPLAGDGQTAAPGAPVAVRPAAIVRDAANRPVPNVAVVFAVDTGGGSLSATSASTGPDGVATAGDWTLGSNEGVNRVKATVGSLPPATFSASAVFPTTLLADTGLSSAGGTIRYRKAGDPLSGASLTIPAGAYPAGGHWRIESKSAATAPKFPTGHTSTPVLFITTDLALSDSVLLLTLPIRATTDSFTALFLRDPVSGRMEVLSPVSITDTSLTVAARHFAPDLLVGPAVPAGLRLGRGTPQSMQVLAVTSAVAELTGGIVTAFQPGVDDWEFPNYGTYVTPNGQSVGQSLSALYFFLANFPNPISLWSNPQFDTGRFWADNAQGVRLVGAAETRVNWPSVATYIKGISTNAIANGFSSLDGAHFLATAVAMSVTRQPQLLTGLGSQFQGYYGLIAYKMDATGIFVIDPNRPGVGLRIPFANQVFGPVSFGPYAGAPTAPFSNWRVVTPSAAIRTSVMVGLFAEAAQGRAGDVEFPPYRIQYFDEEAVAWTDLTTATLQVGWQDIQLRAICPSCARPIPSISQPGLMAVDIYDGQAAQLATDRTFGQVTFRVPADGKVGIHLLGGVNSCSGCATAWRHVDFKSITIQATRLLIAPDPMVGTVNQPVAMAVKNLDLGTPAGASYVWDFGDNQTLTVVGDSSVSHAWTAFGNYAVSVVVKTPAGQTYGRAKASAAIGVAVPIWRFTALTEQVTGTTANDESGVLSSYVNRDINSLIEPIMGAPSTGLLFYQAAPFSAGGGSFPAGLYVQGNNTGSAVGIDPTKPFAPLARPANPPYVDQFQDALVLDGLTQQGNLSAGTMGGTSVTRKRDLTSYQGAGGVHTASHWQVTANKQGTVLTGTITYYLEQWVLSNCNPRGSLNCIGSNGGTLKWDFQFRAVRVR